MITWYDNTRMTPNRRLCAEMMERHEEGLGPRCYRTLLQVADNDERLSMTDIDWLTDGVDTTMPPLVEREGEKVWLTPVGKQLVDAADRGDYKVIFMLTTMKHLQN